MLYPPLNTPPNMNSKTLGTLAASILAAAFLAISSGSSSAQVLYATQTDWALWTGGSNPGTAGSTGDTDFSTTNGDWSSSPGLTGLAGALTITVTGTYYPTLVSRPGADRLLLSGKTMSVDYTTTGLSGGNYFEVRAVVNTDGIGWTVITPLSTTDMGTYYRNTYLLPTFSTPGTYLDLAVLANTDRTGTFTIDNLTVVPEPATTGLAIAGIAILAWRIRRRRP